MLRIGEFAALSSISIHMLRNYDKIGLLIPQHVDEMNGYRYYDKAQLLQVNRIIALKAMGFGLDEIKEILIMPQSEIDAFLQAKLQDKYMELEKTKNQIKQIQIVMNTDKKSEDYALSIVRKIIAPMWVASFRGNIHAYPEEGVLWGQLDKACKSSGIKINTESPAMAIYHGVDENNGMMDVEVQFPLDKEYKTNDKLAIFQLPEREVAAVVFKGCYSQIGGINAVIAEWLEKNYLEINGQSFSIYHSSPGNCSDDKAFITELCFPVKEKN
ncbi:MerR family transcriptional regulator [Clostridium oryzae]|uniref:Multidrug-efflux transporter 1 regulator n=1 Tax=Clostridium oryzae TaxID=1450648 RepID=A0A1V4IWS5_9CLOT|nr:MerR family transcriptional regulator [Clostridium oryzae]OPJ64235.1 multidrug-efflux transporter 1 regulator [Clostridium oryzae]